MRLETPVFDFGDEAEAGRWTSVDDRVMGGVSTSRLTRTDRNTCVFVGIVSREHGGGFASVRTESAAVDLSGASAVTLRFRGDGKTYRLRLVQERLDAGFEVSFPTAPGVWTKRTFGLREFAATRRGRPVPGASALDPAAVRGVGFVIGGGQEGAFRLEIASLSKR